MPVIRGQTPVSDITPQEREQVAEQLAKELSGEPTPRGPVIFEIPFEGQDQIDVLVVWDAWRPFNSTDRSSMILKAYDGRGKSISQALGVTYQEAIEQQVLPYAVMPMARQGETNEKDMEKAMLDVGGIPLPSGKVDLRFPTMSFAKQAHQWLTDQLPKGYWSIVQSVGYIE